MTSAASRPLLAWVGGALVLVVVAGLWWAVWRAARDKDRPNLNEDTTTAGWFRDVTEGSGINFTYRNGEEADQYTILESVGGGVGLIDYDGDGLLDVFVTGGGTFEGAQKKTLTGKPCKMYRNVGNLKFQDATAQLGLETLTEGQGWFYTHGVAIADYDRDGWPDLLVTGYTQLALFHNEPDGKGGRRFVDVTASAGLAARSWFASAGFGDYDGDGWPDLYVCTYVDWSWDNNPTCDGVAIGVKRDVCPPQKFKPLRHFLFQNDRGKFRDVSIDQRFKAAGCGLGVLWVDVNGDARPDIYVANDATENFLFLNRGGRLQECAAKVGVAVDDNGNYNGSMGVDAADYDGSGRPSLWVTNFQGELHALYQNLGKESFLHQSRTAGIGVLGLNNVGFGTAFVDVDRDGWEDLVIANGHVLRFPKASTLAQPPSLMRNVEYRGRRFFRDVSELGGPFFKQARIGRGVAVGDLDNDGRADLVISHSNGPVVVLRNEHEPEARWVGLKLLGRDRRDIVGTTVIVETESRRLTRFVKSGGSYLSANDERLIVGLGDEQVKRITVQWSWGKPQVYDTIELGRYTELRELTK